MLPKYIQELAKDQNLTGGGTNGGAQTHSRNGRLLSILPLLWSMMLVPLKLSFWSAPGHSTLKYNFFQPFQSAPPITMYCHLPLRRELRSSWRSLPQKSVLWKMSAGKRGAIGGKGVYLTLPFTWPFRSFWAGDICGQIDINVGWSPSRQHLNPGPGFLSGFLHHLPLQKPFLFGYDMTLTTSPLQQAALSLPIPLNPPPKAHAGKPTGS